MTGLISLKAVSIIAKLYAGYAYSLAFIFQSSLVLILAVLATCACVLIKEQQFKRRQPQIALARVRSSQAVRDTNLIRRCRR